MLSMILIIIIPNYCKQLQMAFGCIIAIHTVSWILSH